MSVSVCVKRFEILICLLNNANTNIEISPQFHGSITNLYKMIQFQPNLYSSK